MPYVDPIDQLWETLAKVRRNADRALTTDTPLAAKVRPLVDRVLAGADTIRDTLSKIAGDVTILARDPRYSATEQRRLAAEAVAAGRAAVENELAAMRTVVNEITTTTRAACTPPRPTLDATGLAELQRRESLWKLAADGLPAVDVPDRLEQLLADAVANADDVAVWALTAGGWPVAYLESRGLATEARMWPARAAELSTATLSPDAVAARRMLDDLEGAHGLGAAVAIAEAGARMRFDDVARLVPA